MSLLSNVLRQARSRWSGGPRDCRVAVVGVAYRHAVSGADENESRVERVGIGLWLRAVD